MLTSFQKFLKNAILETLKMKINDNCINHLSATQAIKIDRTFSSRDTAEIQYSEIKQRYVIIDTVPWNNSDTSKLKDILKDYEIIIMPLQQSAGKPKSKEVAGKPILSLVPRGIVEAIAKVREFGNKKYGNPDGWKNMSKQDYWEACLRHAEAARNNVDAIDKESGLRHIEHLACDLSFILSGELK